MALPRRLVVVATALGLTATLLLPQARATALTSARPAILDVTGWQVQSVAGRGAPTPKASDGIGPGSYVLITRSDGTFICTANFIWQGVSTYLGAAGHCFLKPGESSLADGNSVSRVQVCVSNCFFGGQLGAVVRGAFATLGSVFYARQLDPRASDPKDIGHDFGLVTIPSALFSKIRRTVPVWGGPSGSASLGTGNPVCFYGNGVVAGETFATKARAGAGELQRAGAWYAALPGSPGDSGSGVVKCLSTAAIGILTHIVVGVPTGIAGTTVAQAIAMVASDTGTTIGLA